MVSSAFLKSVARVDADEVAKRRSYRRLCGAVTSDAIGDANELNGIGHLSDFAHEASLAANMLYISVFLRCFFVRDH